MFFRFFIITRNQFLLIIKALDNLSTCNMKMIEIDHFAVEMIVSFFKD